jgi:hypothetical protein
MHPLPRALARALASLAHPRMLLLMIWPIAVALVIWTAVAVLFGAQTVAWLQGAMTGPPLAQWLPIEWLRWIGAALGWVAILVLFVPLVLVTATVILGIFAMPWMVSHVGATDYAALERRRGGTVAGSIRNALGALGVFVLFSLLSLPLWFVPVFWPVLPVLLLAYLNQRVFRYDALAEHASAEEMSEIFRRHGRSLYLLGIVVSLVAQVPFVGFFVPVIAGLAFIHYCLERLAELRGLPATT